MLKNKSDCRVGFMKPREAEPVLWSPRTRTECEDITKSKGIEKSTSLPPSLAGRMDPKALSSLIVSIHDLPTCCLSRKWPRITTGVRIYVPFITSTVMNDFPPCSLSASPRQSSPSPVFQGPHQSLSSLPSDPVFRSCCLPTWHHIVPHWSTSIPQCSAPVLYRIYILKINFN